jgi:MFS family permease
LVTGGNTRLWTGGFLLAIATNFFVSMVFYLPMTTMALYAVDRFNASDSAAGLASSAFIIGAVIARLFAGKMLDLVGRRRMLLAGLLVYSVVAFFYAPTDDLGVLIAVRIVHGVGFGAAATVIAASVVSMIPFTRRGEGMGYFSLSATLATAIGPFIAVVLVNDLGHDWLFAFTTGCAAVALVLGLFLRLPERTQTEDERATRWRLRWSDLLDPWALPISLVMLLGGIAISGVLAFLNSYANADNMVEAASLFFLVYAGGVVVSRLVVGRLQDRHGDNVVMYSTLALFAAGLVVIGMAPDGVVLMLGGVLLGLGFGGLLPSGQVIAVSLAPDHRVGTATATYFLMLDLGSGFGPMVLGFLIPHTGYPGMYGLLAGVVVVAMALYHFVHGHRRRGEAVA